MRVIRVRLLQEFLFFLREVSPTLSLSLSSPHPKLYFLNTWDLHVVSCVRGVCVYVVTSNSTKEVVLNNITASLNAGLVGACKEDRTSKLLVKLFMSSNRLQGNIFVMHKSQHECKTRK